MWGPMKDRWGGSELPFIPPVFPPAGSLVSERGSGTGRQLPRVDWPEVVISFAFSLKVRP